MALHEEYDNTQDQLQWIKHLEKERQDFSASVEETLADTSSLPQDEWDDSDENLPLDTSRKTALIPPRLSLQSKMLPAVRAESARQSLTGVQQAIPASKEQNTAATPQGPNVFRRIAQRLTAVFGASEQNEVAAVGLEQEKTMVAERPRRQQTALLPAIPAAPPYALDEHSNMNSMPRPTVVDAVPSVRQPVMPVRVAEMVDTDTGKQRLAGRNTRVRLEAVSSSPPPTPPAGVKNVEEVNARPVQREMREPLDIIVRTRTLHGISEGGVSRETGENQRVAAVEAAVSSQGEASLHGRIASAERSSLSGSDTFESGQRERVVKNGNITAASVVQVMLTANPGPVAVHYISLQPQVGFTVHLTGPASMKTPFNYVILLCELF